MIQKEIIINGITLKANVPDSWLEDERIKQEDKMEIKTTEEISVEDYTKVANKRWVAVDDILKVLDDDSILSLEDLTEYLKTELTA